MSDRENRDLSDSPSPWPLPEASHPPPHVPHAGTDCGGRQSGDVRGGDSAPRRTDDGSGSFFDGEAKKYVLAGAALLIVAATSVGLLGSPFTPSHEGNQAVPAAAKTGNSILIRPVAANELSKAVTTLMMNEQDKSRVRAAVDEGKLRLGWITVSDIRAEDGDWVRLAAAGFLQDIPLRHKPFTIAVPYIPGSTISVTGLVDGGGGDITVAVYAGGARVSLKPLKKGEVLHIPSP